MQEHRHRRQQLGSANLFVQLDSAHYLHDGLAAVLDEPVQRDGRRDRGRVHLHRHAAGQLPLCRGLPGDLHRHSGHAAVHLLRAAASQPHCGGYGPAGLRRLLFARSSVQCHRRRQLLRQKRQCNLPLRWSLHGRCVSSGQSHLLSRRRRFYVIKLPRCNSLALGV